MLKTINNCHQKHLSLINISRPLLLNKSIAFYKSISLTLISSIESLKIHVTLHSYNIIFYNIIDPDTIKPLKQCNQFHGLFTVRIARFRLTDQHLSFIGCKFTHFLSINIQICRLKVNSCCRCVQNLKTTLKWGNFPN